MSTNRPTFSRAEAAALYESGLTLKEVGDELGVTKQAVHTALKRMGVPRRKLCAPRRERRR